MKIFCWRVEWQGLNSPAFYWCFRFPDDILDADGDVFVVNKYDADVVVFVSDPDNDDSGDDDDIDFNNDET